MLIEHKECPYKYVSKSYPNEQEKNLSNYSGFLIYTWTICSQIFIVLISKDLYLEVYAIVECNNMNNKEGKTKIRNHKNPPF